MRPENTIAAISTPRGEGAIAIVRISGSGAIAVADGVFQGKMKLEQAQSHTLLHGTIGTARGDQGLDEVLVSLMRAPATYTGEDMVEINCHGGVLITRKVLELVLDHGARLATPGEFTRRAFLNGRLDLAQAEAVADVISSRAESSLKMAQRLLSGVLSKEIGEIRQGLVEALSLVEADLDFSDQEFDLNVLQEAGPLLEEAESRIEQLLDGASLGQHLRDGFNVVIVGRPNVGKSSLFNSLLRCSRAIVTHVPGTTRDVISEPIGLDGLPLRLVDTAGLHASEGLVEKEGIRRTRKEMSQADLLLFVMDGSELILEEDRQILEETGDQAGLVVINKIDLPQKSSEQELEALLGGRRQIRASAKEGVGIDEVTKAISEALLNGNSLNGASPLVSRVRHSEALQRAGRKTKEALQQLNKGSGGEIIAIELREGLGALDEITGQTFRQEILDRIFSQFCVGK
ncbi:tRNA uridine-5-carboxymethylaminomethyl(34) synthesis GTPase MnmE [Candidatus Zixiibacteriota bacterium]